jgi:undecaprenyl-diphosphatase
MLTNREWLLCRAHVGARLAASLIIVGVAAVALALLVTGPLAQVLGRDLDAPGSNYFFAQAPAGARLFRSVDALGDPEVAGCIMIAICTVVGVCAHTWAPLCAGAAALLGAIVITSVVRLSTSRSGGYGYGPPGGFPSGHTMAAASVFGTLALLAAGSALPRWLKWPVVLLGAAVPLAVAWSRLALLAHVPSDVIGGVLLGGVWAAAVVRAIRVPPHRHEGARAPRR